MIKTFLIGSSYFAVFELFGEEKLSFARAHTIYRTNSIVSNQSTYLGQRK